MASSPRSRRKGRRLHRSGLGGSPLPSGLFKLFGIVQASITVLSSFVNRQSQGGAVRGRKWRCFPCYFCIRARRFTRKGVKPCENIGRQWLE
jgi:hypothetical protein